MGGAEMRRFRAGRGQARAPVLLLASQRRRFAGALQLIELSLRGGGDVAVGVALDDGPKFAGAVFLAIELE